MAILDNGLVSVKHVDMHIYHLISKTHSCTVEENKPSYKDLMSYCNEYGVTNDVFIDHSGRANYMLYYCKNGYIAPFGVTTLTEWREMNKINA